MRNVRKGNDVVILRNCWVDVFTFIFNVWFHKRSYLRWYVKSTFLHYENDTKVSRRPWEFRVHKECIVKLEYAAINERFLLVSLAAVFAVSFGISIDDNAKQQDSRQENNVDNIIRFYAPRSEPTSLKTSSWDLFWYVEEIQS